ncbi:MAG: PaaI family thioesterase [Pseudomonadota bacterium]
MTWNVSEIQEKFKGMMPFVERNGFRILDIDQGYVKMLAPLAGNENHFGVMYAGAMFSLGELPGGAIYLTTFDNSKFFPLVKDMNISFVRPTLTDATIEVRISGKEAARIERDAEQQGKADFILQSEIKNAAGEVTAVCRGSYQLRKKPT